MAVDTKPRDKAYILARLRRDHPELAERVEAGVLSANAAAIEAGFRKKLTRVEKIYREWVNATLEERQEILQWIGKEDKKDRV